MKQLAFMTPRGVIRCAYCRTDDYGLPPGDTRVNEYHVGVRFGDGLFQDGFGWTVLLEDEDVTDQCVEAVAGRDGLAYLYDLNGAGHRYPCPSGERHGVVVQHRGRVQVVRHPRPRPPAT